MYSIRGLYGITIDNDPNVEANVKAALEGGAKIIQFRDKSQILENKNIIAKELLALCRQFNAIFIINDDIELALSVAADGVHLGKDDLDIKSAREKLGDKIIGVSCYNKLDLAIEAEHLGVDYVAFGRFFPSSTKPNAVAAELDLLNKARERLSLPIVAIGGITINNAERLIEAGASSVAVIDGLFNQKDIKKTAQEFSKLF